MKIQRLHNLPEDIANKQPLVLFDGECTLCSTSVRFLLNHNHSCTLRFCSIQSRAGSEIVKLSGKTFAQADTLLFLQDEILYGYSTAALMITAHLSFPWYLLKVFTIVPCFIRDSLYNFVAANRYRWFGRKSFCITDNILYQNRFLS